MLTTKLKFDTFVIFATASSSSTLSRTGFGLIVITTSTATACGIAISNKVVHDIVLQKNINYKQQHEKYQQTIKSSNKI